MAPPARFPASFSPPDAGGPRGTGHAYAALDLGTNNCRLLVAAPAQGGFRVVDSYSRIVRLGEGLDHSGDLCPEAMTRALAALRVCAARLARRNLRGLRAVATEACRRARNGAAFLAEVRRETGLAIDVISTREEAELALESCASLLARGGRRVLLFDIGGGSTEIAWVRLPAEGAGLGARPEMVGYVSIPYGVVTIAERFGPASFTQAGFQAAVDEIASRLQGFEQVHCIAKEIAQGGVQLLGTSGTATTLAGVALGLPRYQRPRIDGAVLSGAACEAALATLRGLGREGLAAHPCIGPERADFVLPGCAVFAAIRRLWPTSRVVIADRGLREGILLRLMRNDPRAPQRRGARAGRGRTTAGA
ncbi:Ppx/GppA phosphatase family protein [Acidibrevibacterium fodinaquatile]|uniref:Ppx/GppA phosphatase family protein n=1 Tax=Acidibrevibacterium fodinaquatile TaxID=1969806 RepID=UPI000E0DA2E6|nr:Ppx/GppA phosphatase family protein [Acidibrevibacterium fodinaquatile]